MGKKGSNKKAPTAVTGSRASITLREESTGKKQTNIDAKSLLKLEHKKNLAVWASGEASIPSLGAFFGHRLAAYAEALGTSPDPSIFTCQRCESVLQPGYNCTIRIEKYGSKARHTRKRTNLSPQNNVVYKCHFCSHRNLVRGTPKGHLKDISPPKAKQPSKPEPTNNIVQQPASSEREKLGNVEVNQTAKVASSDNPKDDPITNSPATPSAKMGITLLEGKMRKRNRSGSKKAVESESSSVGVDSQKAICNKRRRKSWTSLKELVDSKENDSSRSLTVPFFI